MAIRLDIIIVSWNVCPLLVRCLRTIEGQTGAGTPLSEGMPLDDDTLHVYVVDNHSSDDTVATMGSQFPWVNLLANTRNVGFTGGNNQALPYTQGEYVLLLNPDTELAPDAVRIMLDTMAGRPRCGVLGPRLTYGDGTLQPSRRRFPRLPDALFESTLLEQWFPRNRWARSYRMEDVSPDVAQPVDWMTGACLLTRRVVWDEIGLLDDRFFMYSEELDWCRRAAEAGWERYYQPQAHVIHHEGRSSGQVAARRHYLFNTSKILYWQKHHGRAAAQFLRLFLLSTFALQWLEEGLKWLLGHRRALRRERLAAFGWLLRTGLRRSPGNSEETG